MNFKPVFGFQSISVNKGRGTRPDVHNTMPVNIRSVKIKCKKGGISRFSTPINGKLKGLELYVNIRIFSQMYFI